jgi:hypothetical protein
MSAIYAGLAKACFCTHLVSIAYRWRILEMIYPRKKIEFDKIRN